MSLNLKRSVSRVCRVCAIICVTLIAASESLEAADHRKEIDGAFSDLKLIGGAIRLASIESTTSVDALLACRGTNATIASAEDVILPLLGDQGVGKALLTSISESNLTPKAEKWSSSYNSWCLTKDEWVLAVHFQFLLDSEETLGLGFPLMWTKNSDLYGGRVVLLLLDGSCQNVTKDSFEPYLKEAMTWLRPMEVELSQLIEDLKSESPNRKIRALRLLGARGQQGHISDIAESLVDDNLLVKRAAIWALGWIGDSSAISHLKGLRESDDLSCISIIEALKVIGGNESVKYLSQFLRDKRAIVRERAAAALIDMNTPEAAIELTKGLDDPNGDVRRTAREALDKLRKEQ